jgi:hypothetical protein
MLDLKRGKGADHMTKSWGLAYYCRQIHGEGILEPCTSTEKFVIFDYTPSVVLYKIVREEEVRV